MDRALWIGAEASAISGKHCRHFPMVRRDDPTSAPKERLTAAEEDGISCAFDGETRQLGGAAAKYASL
jgi:hypothetical protein